MTTSHTTSASETVTSDDAEIDVAFVSVGIILTLVAFFGNLGTILAFCTDHRVHAKPSDYMILNLACADFGIACFVMPLRLVTLNILKRWPLRDIGCRFLVFTEMTLLTAGILFVILISFDRYQMLALDYTDYLKKWSKKQVVKIIAFTWMVSLLPGIFEVATWDVTLASIPESMRPNFSYTCSNPSSWRIFTNIICITFVAVIPTSVVALLGVLIVFKLHRRLKQWRKVGVSVKSVVTETEMSTVPGGSTTRVFGGIQNTTLNSYTTTTSTGYAVGTDQNDCTQSQDKKSGPQGNMKQPIIAESNAKDGHMNQAPSLKPPADSKQKSHHTDKSSSQSKETIHNRYIRPIITYICLVLCITLCNFPISIYALMLSTSCPQCYNQTLVACLVSLMYFTSCLNPLMYALTNAKIRGFYGRHYHHVMKAFRTYFK